MLWFNLKLTPTIFKGTPILKNISITCLLLLASCYVAMPYDQQTENLIAPPPLECTITTSLESPYFSLGTWPSDTWWEIFDSPQLSCLITEALAQNPTIQEVETTIQYSKQETIVAKSRLFPYLSFDAEITKSYLSQNGLYRALNPTVPLNANLIDLSLSLQYEFDFWGKNYNIFLAALGETLAQEAETAQVRLLVTTSIAQAYFALKANLLRKELYESLLKINQGNLELQKLMETSALSSHLDPLLLEESCEETNKLISSINEEIIVGQHLLNYLVGRGPDTPLDIDETLPSLPPSIAIPENLTLDLLARRPDLMAQIWRVQALAHQVGAAIANFYPNVSLTGLVGLESVFYPKIFQNQSKTYNVEPAVHLPIFTAGAIQANVYAHKASFDAAVYAYNNLVLQSTQEVADLLALAQSIYTQKAAQDRIVNASQTRSELTTLRKNAGLDNRFDEYRIQIELVNRKLENVSLLYGQYVATIKLIKALGGGYQSKYCIPLQADGVSS